MQATTSPKTSRRRTSTPAVAVPVKSRRIRPAVVWVSLVSIMVIIPLLFMALAVVAFQIFQWNLPNVTILDLDVGMMNPEQTAEKVDRQWNRNRTILASSNTKVASHYAFSPKALGYWVDPAATAFSANSVGRRAEVLNDLGAVLRSDPQVILPTIYFDESAARETLKILAEDFLLPPENAAVVYQDSQWEIQPGADGQALDIETTLQHLQQDAFTNLLTQSATLFVKPLAIEIPDLKPVLSQIDSLTSLNPCLVAYDPILDETYTFDVPQTIKNTWIELDPNTYQVSFEIENESLQGLINTWERELGEGRTFENLPVWDEISQSWENGDTVNAVIHHSSTTYQVQPGESLWSISLDLGMPMWRIMEANPGLTTSNLEAGVQLTIPSKNDLLPLPVIPNKRILIDISDQSMTVLENGQVRNQHIVSTGMSDSPTMAGVFQVQTHEINAYASNWDLYMPHFMGIYEAWPDFMNGIHGLPLLANGRRLWASSLGSPASYGCIILDLDAAEDLYQWADPGVVVEITQ